MSGHNTLQITPVASKTVTVTASSSSPNGSVQSFYIQAIFALEVKVSMRNTIPQEKTGSYVMLLLLSQKVSTPSVKWPLPKRKQFCISL